MHPAEQVRNVGTIYQLEKDVVPFPLTYALRFHQAFITQSLGESTKAFFQFQGAYQEALKAGEMPQKLASLDGLFQWYRRYGSCLHLFTKEPIGNNVITNAYHDRTWQRAELSSQNSTSQYYSEWGNTPEQAGHIRDFMLGVGETISGFVYFHGQPNSNRNGLGTV